jgi:antitoxin PrlF
MTTTLTVTAKGQVTLRKEVLRHLGVTPGARVEVDLLPNGRLELRAAKAAAPIEDFFGCLHRPGTKPLTIEEIGEIAAEGWFGRH